jgi:hypothetical protein
MELSFIWWLYDICNFDIIVAVDVLSSLMCIFGSILGL